MALAYNKNISQTDKFVIPDMIVLVLLSIGFNQIKQEDLLLQRDHATRLSVQILQLQNIPF